MYLDIYIAFLESLCRLEITDPRAKADILAYLNDSQAAVTTHLRHQEGVTLSRFQGRAQLLDETIDIVTRCRELIDEEKQSKAE